MGAWGHRSFDNDDALDWLGDLEEQGPILVQDALEQIVALVAYDDSCSAALAAAELVAAAHGRGDDRLNETAAAWLRGNRAEVATIDRKLAHRAVERIVTKSELRDLWSEGGDASEWESDVRELMHRLAR